MPQNLTIKPLSQSDYEPWLALWQGYLRFYKAEVSDAITARNWQVISANAGPLYGLGAYDASGQLLGFVHYLLHPYTWGLADACYMEDLYIDEAARGMGAGRALIDALIAKGKAEAWGRLYWNTQIDNTRARALYDSYTPINDFVQYKLSL
jgi:ribosomal protein S18 acetylase RimI-like enzyme